LTLVYQDGKTIGSLWVQDGLSYASLQQDCVDLGRARLLRPVRLGPWGLWVDLSFKRAWAGLEVATVQDLRAVVI